LGRPIQFPFSAYFSLQISGSRPLIELRRTDLFQKKIPKNSVKNPAKSGAFAGELPLIKRPCQGLFRQPATSPLSRRHAGLRPQPPAEISTLISNFFQKFKGNSDSNIYTVRQ
jgi:hypothetical protein